MAAKTSEVLSIKALPSALLNFYRKYEAATKFSNNRLQILKSYSYTCHRVMFNFTVTFQLLEAFMIERKRNEYFNNIIFL